MVCTAFGQSNSSSKKIGPIDERLAVVAKIDSAKKLFSTNPIAAFEKVESAVTTAVKLGYRFELAEAYYTLSGFNANMEEYNSALLHAGRALPIYQTLEAWDKVYQCYLLMGKSCVALDDIEMGLTHYKNAMQLAKKGGKTEAYLKAKFELAALKLKQGKTTEAENLFATMRQEATEAKLNDLVAEIDYKLGEIYELKGEQTRANDYYETAHSNALNTKNSTLLNRTNERFVQSYTNNGTTADNNKISNSLNEAEVYFQNSGDTVSLLDNSIQKADLLIAQGNFSDAADELNYSLDLSQQYGDLNKQITSTKKLYDVYDKADNNTEASKVYNNYKLLLDSASRLKEQKKQLTNQNQFALKTVEKQIDNLEQERKLNRQTIELLQREKNLNNQSIEQQQVLLYVFGVILVLFLAASIFVYRNIKAKKRAHQLLYLKSLRAQMNPHFIFNSLNSVNNYISKSNERAANKYLAKFSKLMRQVLEYSQVEFISLAKEIEILQLYVELEHERFKDKFDFTFLVDDSINIDSYTIPPMLVQPFIENAIWHGLRYKEDSGLLEVLLKDHNDYVEITVRDNGIGRTKSQELKTVNQKKHRSSGMQNVENRTEMIQAVFKTKISYEIHDLPQNTGTLVRIKLYRNG